MPIRIIILMMKKRSKKMQLADIFMYSLILNFCAVVFMVIFCIGMRKDFQRITDIVGKHVDEINNFKQEIIEFVCGIESTLTDIQVEEYKKMAALVGVSWEEYKKYIYLDKFKQIIRFREKRKNA